MNSQEIIVNGNQEVIVEVVKVKKARKPRTGRLANMTPEEKKEHRRLQTTLANKKYYERYGDKVLAQQKTKYKPVPDAERKRKRRVSKTAKVICCSKCGVEEALENTEN